MDSIECQEVLRGYLYGIVSVLVSHVSYSTSLVSSHIRGMFIGCRLYSLRTMCMHKCHWCFTCCPMQTLPQSQYTLMCGRCLPGWCSAYHYYHATVSTWLLLASRDKREHVTTFHDIWSQHSAAVNCVSWNVVVCVMISSWWFICQFQNFGIRQP